MVIIPPPEIRNIIEKTASAVAKNGAAFELRIKDSEKLNSKFSFLNPLDPYRAFYDERVEKLANSQTVKPTAQKVEPEPARHVQPPPDRPAPYDFLHLKSHPPISQTDHEILQLTARFTASHGRKAFTNPLAQREARNFQFEFLKPGHSLYAYFNQLVDAYSMILVSGRDKFTPILEK
jgi:splicing factor 3A subunit 1